MVCLNSIRVLAALDGVYLHADNLNVIFIQDACLRQLGAKIKTGLSAEVRQ